MNFTKKKFWLAIWFILTLVVFSNSYAIVQKSVKVEVGEMIRASTTNDIIQDITSLNAAIDTITAGSDVKIGALEANKWCTSNGTKINCAENAPTLTETDPKIGTITEGKYCLGIGDKVVCNSNGSFAWGDLTGVPAGFSDGTDADTIYTHPVTAGNKHVPAGGATDNVLKYSADGTAVWGTDADTIYTHPTTAGNQGCLTLQN